MVGGCVVGGVVEVEEEDVPPPQDAKPKDTKRIAPRIRNNRAFNWGRALREPNSIKRVLRYKQVPDSVQARDATFEECRRNGPDKAM